MCRWHHGRQYDRWCTIAVEIGTLPTVSFRFPFSSASPRCLQPSVVTFAEKQLQDSLQDIGMCSSSSRVLDNVCGQEGVTFFCYDGCVTLVLL